MKISEILNETVHRPWSLPDRSYGFYQEWNDVVFLHWQVEESELRKWVPDMLELDYYEGKPWVSVVAFTMENIRLKNLPAFFPVSNFPEVNIRTYVKYKGKSGVHFLSIEAGNRVSAKLSKTISGMPYRYSAMNRSNGWFTVQNKEFNDLLKISFQIAENEVTSKSDLDLWLTERYALFQDESDRYMNAFDVHHIPWPMNDITITNLNIDYKRFGKLLDGNPDFCHYSKGVQVVAWSKEQYSLEIDKFKG